MRAVAFHLAERRSQHDRSPRRAPAPPGRRRAKSTRRARVAPVIGSFCAVGDRVELLAAPRGEQELALGHRRCAASRPPRSARARRACWGSRSRPAARRPTAPTRLRLEPLDARVERHHARPSRRARRRRLRRRTAPAAPARARGRCSAGISHSGSRLADALRRGISGEKRMRRSVEVEVPPRAARSGSAPAGRSTSLLARRPASRC